MKNLLLYGVIAAAIIYFYSKSKNEGSNTETESKNDSDMQNATNATQGRGGSATPTQGRTGAVIVQQGRTGAKILGSNMNPVNKSRQKIVTLLNARTGQGYIPNPIN